MQLNYAIKKGKGKTSVLNISRPKLNRLNIKRIEPKVQRWALHKSKTEI